MTTKIDTLINIVANSIEDKKRAKKVFLSGDITSRTETVIRALNVSITELSAIHADLREIRAELLPNR